MMEELYVLADADGREYLLEIRQGSFHSLTGVACERRWFPSQVYCAIPLATEEDLHTIIACKIPFFRTIGATASRLGPFLRFCREGEE